MTLARNSVLGDKTSEVYEPGPILYVNIAPEIHGIPSVSGTDRHKPEQLTGTGPLAAVIHISSRLLPSRVHPESREPAVALSARGMGSDLLVAIGSYRQIDAGSRLSPGACNHVRDIRRPLH